MQSAEDVSGRTAIRSAIRGGAQAAARKLAPFIMRTPMIRSKILSDLTGGHVYLKLECAQHTGSGEARAALGAMTHCFKPGEKLEIVAASTGNFGFALAWCARRFGADVSVILPGGSAAHKRAALERSGATVVDGGHDFATACASAAHMAQVTGLTLIERQGGAAFTGLATIAAELEEQIAELGIERPSAIVVPVGTGTMATAIGAFLRDQQRDLQIIGARSHPVDYAPGYVPLADAVASVEPTRAEPPPHGEVDELIELTEDEIAIAMASMHATHGLDLEGTGALAAAAVMRESARFRGQTIVAVLSGANVDPAQQRQISGPYARFDPEKSPPPE